MHPHDVGESNLRVTLVTDDYGNVVECLAKPQTDDFGNEIGPGWEAMRKERWTARA